MILYIYHTRFIPMVDALSIIKIPIAMKLVTLSEKEKFIGLHVIGHGADDLLQGFGVAIKMGTCKKKLDNTIAINLASAEKFVTMV